MVKKSEFLSANKFCINKSKFTAHANDYIGIGVISTEALKYFTTIINQSKRSIGHTNESLAVEVAQRLLLFGRIVDAVVLHCVFSVFAQFEDTVRLRRRSLVFVGIGIWVGVTATVFLHLQSKQKHV